ncbi:MAG: molybdenum cofactor guanylyltransferase [Rhodocyclales bacterium]|nr:molybdenum cofactor guanylyltransferase [Rhodocyclales bacterium]
MQDNASHSPAAITGVILAGGEGRRMGGADKGLLLLDGRPLVQRVLERLLPQVDAVLISANRNLEHYAGFGCRVVTDITPGFAGPLAGLQAAMARADTPLLLSAPCDSPLLPADLAARMRAALIDAGAELAVPRAGGRVHRAFCLVRRDLLPRLDAFLAGGDRRLGLWHETLHVVEVDFEDRAAAFANLNSMDELDCVAAGRRVAGLA